MLLREVLAGNLPLVPMLNAWGNIVASFTSMRDARVLSSGASRPKAHLMHINHNRTLLKHVDNGQTEQDCDSQMFCHA